MTTLESIPALWRPLIARAVKHKEDKFARTARRLWAFRGKSYEDLYVNVDDPDYKLFTDGGGPNFKARLNLTKQFEDTYLPHLHFRVPQRVVEPSRPQVPPELLSLATGQEIPPGTPLPKTKLEKEDATRSWLMQWFLNYTPGEYNLKKEGELAIREALVKGRGVVWCELIDTPYGEIPISRFESIDGLLIDPDCEQLREAGWIARKRRANRYALADEHGLKPERLKPSDLGRTAEEGNTNTDIEGDDWLKQNAGDAHETVVYYEVYCRKGLGTQFGKGPEAARETLSDLPESLGYLADEPCYLVLVPGVSFPLNLPPEIFADDRNDEEVTIEDEVRARLAWPIPFHRDKTHPWPCTPLDFDPHTKDPWATSPLEAGLPLQVFLDQTVGFLMDGLAASARRLLFVDDSLEAKVKQALTEGVDHLVIGVDKAEEIRTLVYEMTFESATEDIYKVMGIVQKKYEEITGQDPLLGGDVGATQPRSSGEMTIRNERASTRPDDYAERVEAWHGMVARKEGFAARLIVSPLTVTPLFGEEDQVETDPKTGELMKLGPLGQLWAELVNTNNPDKAAAELSYTIEVGSGRKKNKQKQSQDVQMVSQNLIPTLGQVYMTTGDPTPLNAFVQMLGKAFDVRLDDVMFPDLQEMMQQQAAQGQQDPEAEQAALEAEQAVAQVALQAEQVKVELQRVKVESDKLKIVMEQIKLQAQQAAIELQQAKTETAEVQIETEKAKAETEQERAKVAKAKPKPTEGSAA